MANDTIIEMMEALVPENSPEAIARARSSGIRTAGYCCPYVPAELILAHGMLPVRLDRTGAPAGSCCPCASAAGAETASASYPAGMLDGIIATSRKGPGPGESPPPQPNPGLPVISLELPPCQDRYRTSLAPGRDFRAGLKSLDRALGALSGQRPNYLDIMRPIMLEKRIRQSLRKLYEAPLAEGAVPDWRHIERLTRAGFHPDRAGFRAGLESLEAEAAGTAPGPAGGASRLMLYGPPLDGRADEVLDLVEASGGLVVTDYICTASSRLRKQVPVWGVFERPLESLTELYLYNAPCPFMGDYGARLERMLALARWYRVHGLICLNPGSDPVFKADFERLSEDFYSRLFIPSLAIEDRLPLEDPEGLGARVSGFIDIIGGRL